MSSSRRFLGQHFLQNKSAIKKIVAALELQKNDLVVEVGPGHGELTSELQRANSKVQIVAIEKDFSLARLLKEKFTDAENIKIDVGDVLKELPRIVGSEQFAIRHLPFAIVGNIPYYITGHLLRIIGELKNKPSLCVFTMQREVAERIAASPPRMNKLAAAVQFWAEPEIIGYVSKEDFSPPPEVDSAIVKLKIKNGKWKIKDADYYRAVRAIFAQPRQTILNNLRRATKLPKEKLAAELKKIGVRPEDRPQNLSVEDIEKITSSMAP